MIERERKQKDMFEMKSSERWLFTFYDSIAADGSANGNSAGMIYAGGKKKRHFSMTWQVARS
ncbi:MAG: hypothetical protein ACLRTA_01910 [Clostridia bacterium]